ncbi:sensor domain-containing phosphodiesterase [Bacillaceae bacterium W0354]
MANGTINQRVLSAEEFVEGYQFITQYISEGVPLKFVLVQALKFFEGKMNDTYCTIMILNDNGTAFVDSVAHSMPCDVLNEIKNIKIEDGLGSCGAAVVRKELVITENIDKDPNWDLYRDVFQSMGLKSCWSVPIFAPSNKKVLATFAMYSKKVQQPSEKEIETIQAFNNLIGLVISSYRQTEIDPVMLDNAFPLVDSNDISKDRNRSDNKFIKSIREGIDRSEFVPYYQPIIFGGNQDVYGVEALARWDHPEDGIISPYYFIGAAERHGLINQLDEVISYKAMKDMKLIMDETGRKLVLSINVSAQHISQEDYVRRMEKIMSITNFKPEYLSLEITETSLIENLDEVAINIAQLKNLGVRISIDDFGTNYSSLNYLKHLPVDTIKLDQTFVHDVQDNQIDQRICKTIIQLGKDLELDVVAEGIEQEEHLEIIESYGCEIFQGYYFSKPLNKENWMKYLNKKI